MSNYSAFWFPPEEFKVLTDFINQEKLHTEIINNIRLETSVAKVRSVALHKHLSDLVLALGLPKESMPLYFNDEELKSLLNLKNLPISITEVLK